jgi:predicted lysophospholipase L1 biosynthesis ABC-type transport system permease subunit
MMAKNHPKESMLLISPSVRRKFIIQFIFITVLGWVVGGIVSTLLENSMVQVLPNSIFPNEQTKNLLAQSVNSTAFAVIFAAFQALVLWRYVSGWLWMLATSIGWLLANSVSAAWINYILAIATSTNQNLSPRAILFWGFVSTFAYILSGIWLGICQWLVLRMYSNNSGQWIFVPSIAFLCISLFLLLLSRISNLIPSTYQEIILYWSQQLFTAIILGIVPALSLCKLKNKSL